LIIWLLIFVHLIVRFCIYKYRFLRESIWFTYSIRDLNLFINVYAPSVIFWYTLFKTYHILHILVFLVISVNMDIIIQIFSRIAFYFLLYIIFFVLINLYASLWYNKIIYKIQILIRTDKITYGLLKLCDSF